MRMARQEAAFVIGEPLLLCELADDEARQPDLTGRRAACVDRLSLPLSRDGPVVVETVDGVVEVAHEAVAAQLAIGQDAEAKRALPLEELQNFGVFDLAQRSRRDAWIRARIENRAWPKEAADVVGAIRDRHAYLNASFALRSSSARIDGPKSFWKKPSFTSRSTVLLSMSVR